MEVASCGYWCRSRWLERWTLRNRIAALLKEVLTESLRTESCALRKRLSRTEPQSSMSAIDVHNASLVSVANIFFVNSLLYTGRRSFLTSNYLNQRCWASVKARPQTGPTLGHLRNTFVFWKKTQLLVPVLSRMHNDCRNLVELMMQWALNDHEKPW